MTTPEEWTLHHDRKTTTYVRHSASKGWQAKVPNAISFPAGPVEVGGSCPGASMKLFGPLYGKGPCDSCYFERMTGPYRSVEDMSVRNYRRAEQLIFTGGTRALADGFSRAVASSVASAERRGVPAMFRWMSGGDIWREEVALAIGITASRFPDVPQWVPTRSYIPGADYALELLDMARDIPNLRVSLSTDTWNHRDAMRVLARFPHVGYAHLDDGSEESASARRALESVAGGAVVCPATGRYAHDGHGSSFIVPLSRKRSDMATATEGMGACAACRVCFRPGTVGPRNVTFNVHGGMPSESTFRRKIALAVGAPVLVTIGKGA